MSSASPYPMAMFPLEQVVLPGEVVPLHIFEPRYRVLAAALRDGVIPEFGMAPITRGREVGGHDQRADVAVAVSIMSCEEFPDGRWSLVAAATRRLRIEGWLPDDPYPVAEVTDWPDQPSSTLTIEVDELLTAFRRLAEAMHRLDGRHDLRTVEFAADDPSRRLWQIIGAAGLGALDQLSLLEAAGTADRTRRATQLMNERAELLTALAEHDR